MFSFNDPGWVPPEAWDDPVPAKPAPRFAPKVIAAQRGQPLHDYTKVRKFDDELPKPVAPKPARKPKAPPKPKPAPKQKTIPTTKPMEFTIPRAAAPVTPAGQHDTADVKICVSSDYERFHMITGNRQLNEAKIKRIKKDIQEGLNVLMYCPVLVVERKGLLDIIDGQHRFHVAQQLQSPVWYIVCPDMTLLDIAKVNSNTERWKDRDFINCYVAQGNDHYLRLQDFMERYRLPVTTALLLLEKGVIDTDNSGAGSKPAFHNGQFQVTALPHAVQTMETVLLFEQFAGCRSRAFIAAICKVVSASKIKIEDLAEKFKRNPEDLTAQSNIKNYLFNLEALYNKGKHSRETIY